jgi:hypothetical protein
MTPDFLGWLMIFGRVIALVSIARSAGRPTSSPLWSRMPVANAGLVGVKALSSTGRGCGCD